MIIDIEEVNDKLFRILQQFSPFGPKNLSPIFISTNVIDMAMEKKLDKTNLI